MGTFDPFPNQRNEKLVGLHVDRIKYWMARDVVVSVSVLELLGVFLTYFLLRLLAFIDVTDSRFIIRRPSGLALDLDLG